MNRIYFHKQDLSDNKQIKILNDRKQNREYIFTKPIKLELSEPRNLEDES